MSVSTWTCDSPKPTLKLGEILPEPKFNLTKKPDFFRINDKLNKKNWVSSTTR